MLNSSDLYVKAFVSSLGWLEVTFYFIGVLFQILGHPAFIKGSILIITYSLDTQIQVKLSLPLYT